MSTLRLGGSNPDGSPRTTDEGPSTAHLSGIGGTSLAGGYPRSYRDAADVPETAPKRRRYSSLRGQAMLDRGRHDR